MDTAPVRVPKDLQGVRATVLEEYVRSRLNQFSLGLERKLTSMVNPDIFERLVAETYTQLPAPEYCDLPIEARELQLVFRHDCLALGCNDQNCALCQHSAIRRCRVNFDRKYLVGDSLHAKCAAPIRIELVDSSTGRVFEDDVEGLEVAMCILDGNRYDVQVGDSNTGSEQEWENLRECWLLTNKRGQPLLVSTGGGGNLAEGHVITRLDKGCVVLPELHVTDSSEALLSGRKPPFRLLAWVIDKQNRNLSIRHAVSEGFVVATRRTRTAGKADIPKVDDDVARLEHMGKETVKKLHDLKLAATAASINLKLPDSLSHQIYRAGEFKQLIQAADQDGTLRQKLQTILKLSKEKWEEAREHAMRCVVPDNRMRAWYSDRHNHELGLLFTCRMGIIDLDRPVALLRWFGSNEHQNIEATLMAQLTPQQREEVRTFQIQAQQCWYKNAHPGWSLCSYDSEQFLATGNFTHVGIIPGIPAQPASPPSPVRTNNIPSLLGSNTIGTSNMYSDMNMDHHLYASSNGQQQAPFPINEDRNGNGHMVYRQSNIPLPQESDPGEMFRVVVPSSEMSGHGKPEPDKASIGSFSFPGFDTMIPASVEHGDYGHDIQNSYIHGMGQPVLRVGSLESMPEDPNHLLRDLSGTFDPMQLGKLGRDESLGLESMQSVEQSIDEVQKEIEAKEERKP